MALRWEEVVGLACLAVVVSQWRWKSGYQTEKGYVLLKEVDRRQEAETAVRNGHAMKVKSWKGNEWAETLEETFRLRAIPMM